MPKPFFQRLQLEPIHVAFEDIVPAASTAARVRPRAVYKDLIHQWPHFLTEAVRDRVESRLRPSRQPAREGRLDTGDFRNIAITGDWHSHTLWHEPFKPLEHSAVSRAWCALRRPPPPNG